MLLSSDLTFNAYIDAKYSKPLRVVIEYRGFVKRNCSDFKNLICLKVLYPVFLKNVTRLLFLTKNIGNPKTFFTAHIW